MTIPIAHVESFSRMNSARRVAVRPWQPRQRRPLGAMTFQKTSSKAFGKYLSPGEFLSGAASTPHTAGWP
jgi:hypothetical protein